MNFKAVEVDFQEITNSEEGKKMLRANPFAAKRNLKTFIYPHIKNSLSVFYQLALESDLVLYHVKTLADCFADQFHHKMIRASVLPIVEATREFPNPAFSGFFIPKIFNRFTYRLSSLSIKILSTPIGEFRKDFGLSARFKTPVVKNIYGLSSKFLPLPADFSRDSKFTGFWFGNSSKELPEDVQKFIYEATPPLVITFGSMPFKTKFDLQSAIVKLADEFQMRIIVVRGWGFHQTELLENHPNILVINSAPYAKLFLLSRAVIHHGGIGTTAKCLRAGKPFFICPILYPLGDQQFWGMHSYRLGLAVIPVPISKLREDVFRKRVRELILQTELDENAKAMRLKISEEDGLNNAVDQIEAFCKKTNAID